MLSIFHGTDRDAMLARVQLLTKGHATSIMGVENFDQGKVQQSLSGTDLFGGTEVLIFKDCFEDSEHQDFLIQLASDLHASSQQFFIVEGQRTKKELTPFEKVGATIENFKAEKKEVSFNVFTLTEALGNRDKKQFWVLFQQAQSQGVRLEELHGLLWWQMKTMLLVANSMSNPGLKPFVFQKAKRFAGNYSDDLQEKAKALLHVLHRARGKNPVPLHLGLEKFILSL